MNPEMSARLVRGDYEQAHKLYPIRFFVCIVVALNNIFNAMIWITFASIQERTADLYHVSQSAVNMFSFTYLILYVPGTFLCSFLFKKRGLRFSFVLSALLQCLGAFLRYLSVNSSFLAHAGLTSSSTCHFAYILAMFGTCLGGLVQPFYTNSPARLAATWFSVEGRDVATALLSLVNPIGIGLGTFLPTLFIQPLPHKNLSGGYAGYLAVQLICAASGLLLTLVFVRDKPPTPPSVSQRLKLEDREGVVNGLEGAESSFIRIKKDFAQIWEENFVLLCLGFGVGLGFFNVLTTLIEQYTAAFGYNSNDAGMFGGLLIAGGIFGAILAGAAMELTRSYNKILKVFTAGTLIVSLVFVTQMKENNIIMVTTLFSLFGFCAIPIVAVTFECAAECTYPCDEEVSSGVLMTAGNLIGVVILLIWQSQLPGSSGSYHNNIWNFSTYLIIVVVVLVAVLLFSYNGAYKRLHAEQSFQNLPGEGIEPSRDRTKLKDANHSMYPAAADSSDVIM